MQCKRCNSFIPEGYLYCPVCGDEVIIVSDFDINLEDNIDMSVLADTREIPDLASGNVVDPFATTREISVKKNVVANRDDLLNGQSKKNYEQLNKADNRKSKDNKRKNTKKDYRMLKISLVIVVILAFVAVTTISIISTVSKYYSYDYQYERASKLIANREYDEAIKVCKRLNTLEENEKGRLLLADCYMANNNYDAAIAVLFSTLDLYPNDVSVYDMIVKCYEVQGDNRGINEFISNSDDTTLAIRYSDYISLSPESSLESGTYIEPDPIKLSAVGNGDIYYTLDESLPTDESLRYIGPIPLELGENHINAIFINDKGIKSDIVSFDYTVELNIPDDPVLLVNSGTINKPELIGVLVRDNEKVYYCEGNSNPDDNSKEYKTPLLMPIGRSIYSFIAYNENGQKSSVVVGSYNLVLDAVIAQSVAEYAISYQLISKGENVIGNTYKTNYGFSDSTRTYYIIEEYCLDELTGRRFAVDITTGELFSFINNPDGSYSTLPL